MTLGLSNSLKDFQCVDRLPSSTLSLSHNCTEVRCMNETEGPELDDLKTVTLTRVVPIVPLEKYQESM